MAIGETPTSVLLAAALAVLSTTLLVVTGACASDLAPTPSSSVEASDSLSPARWTFFEPCDDRRTAAENGPARSAATAPQDCGRLALAGLEGPAEADAPAGDPAPSTRPDSDGTVSKRTLREELLGATLATATVIVAAANSFGDAPEGFHFTNEGWFGQNTYAGGADKAAHFVFSHMLAKELARAYAKIGYSERSSLAIGFGLSTIAGLVTEIGDGTTRYGFSYEDLVMDVLGAGTATLVSMVGADDLVGIRWGFLPRETGTCCQVRGLGSDYSNYIYTADLKLAGVGRRLGLQIGPLKYLLVSVTYGTKGYPSGLPEDRQRRVGFDLGINLTEILSDLGVRRDTWWGYLLQAVGDNVRFPYTAGGFRYDMNRGRWHGPTTR